MQKRVYKTSRGLQGGFQTPLLNLDPPKVKSKKEEKEEMNRLIKERFSKGVAYKVLFKDDPNLVFITFQKTREKARYDACKYFKESFHPDFPESNMKKKFGQSRAYRVKEFDQYSLTGKVPIPKLMETLQVTFPCSVCGKDNFTLEDYKIGRCFLVIGEGDLNPFTEGYILCYECYKKYFPD